MGSKARQVPQRVLVDLSGVGARREMTLTLDVSRAQGLRVGEDVLLVDATRQQSWTVTQLDAGRGDGAQVRVTLRR